MTLTTKTLLSLLLLTTLAACAYRQTVSESVRKVTYPPDFKYVTKDQIVPPMHAMGRELRELNALLRTQGSADPDELNTAVLQHLDAIDQAARSLEGRTGGRSNHPNLQRNLSRLRSDVGDARRAAEQTPPNYFLAGSISGACLYCHGDGT